MGGDMVGSGAPAGVRPKVTHFLYAFRQEGTIRAAVESVLAQTYQPLEIVLSDDCSPDGTYAIMEEIVAAYDGPHQVILNRNPKNLGISRHIERIMELSSGELIVESAGDDISLPHRVERLAAAWLASGRTARAIHSEKRDIDADGRLLPFAPRRDVLAGVAPIDVLRRKYALLGATMAWSRELYDRFGPISDLAVFHDYPLCFRALLLGEVAYVDEPLVHYRTGGVSRGEQQDLGYRYFYGDWIKYMRWDLMFYRSYRRDMQTVAPADPGRARALCEATIARFDFILRMAGMNHRQRLAHLGEALAKSARYRDLAFLRTNLKYLFDKPVMRYLDWRAERALRPGANRMA